MAEQNPEIKITDQCCHITVLALCVPWLCSCHLHWGNLVLFTHILPILQCLDKLTSQDMWQLGHSQSSGHLSCGQLAARHRNNILGQLSPFLARPDLTSRIPFTPTKEPGYVLPWASPACVSTPCSALGTTGVYLHGYSKTQVTSVPGKHWGVSVIGCYHVFEEHKWFLWLVGAGLLEAAQSSSSTDTLLWSLWKHTEPLFLWDFLQLPVSPLTSGLIL